MKKSILLTTLLCIAQLVFANPDYKNGNGTIISSSEKNGAKITIRKCEIDNIKIGDLYNKNKLKIYADYSLDKPAGTLKENDVIKVSEVCTIAHLNKPNDKWNNPAGELWYKIYYNGKPGCLCISSSLGEYTEPYFENRYEVIEEIKTSKTWTVRKLKQFVSVWERLNVRETPGLDGKKVFMLHDFDSGSGKNPQENHEIIAITEETETIDGRTDHWLKIEYAPGKYGWIFGGYATVERGGPKYYIPESMIEFELRWY